MPRPIGACATRCAICWARWTASPRRSGCRESEMPELERWVLHRLARARRRGPPRHDDYDFHTLFTALHNFCAVDLSRLLFRHPQGCALLRPARRAAPARRRTVLDQLLLLPHRLAGAGLLLHRRGGLAERRAMARRRGERASARLSRLRRSPGATMPWPSAGIACAICAGSSPAPSRSSAPPSASARASRPIRRSMPRPIMRPPSTGWIWRSSPSPPPPPCGSRHHPPAPTCCPISPRSGSWWRRRRATNASAAGAS